MCQYHRKLPVYVSNFFWCVCFEPSSVFLLCTTFLFFLLLGWQNQVGKEALSITEVLESAKGALLMESSRKPGCGLVVHDRQLGRWSLHGPRSPQQAAASTQVKLVVRRLAAAKPAESAPFCRWSGSRAGASAEKARVRWPPRPPPRGGVQGGQSERAQQAQIHQKHFFFTFLVFLLKSCFSGTGASAGDFGGGGGSSAASTSSRLCRTSWNLPSCCRKSYSTLKNTESTEGK